MSVQQILKRQNLLFLLMTENDLQNGLFHLIVRACDHRHACSAAEALHGEIILIEVDRLLSVELKSDIGESFIYLPNQLQRLGRKDQIPKIPLCAGIVDPAAVETAVGSVWANELTDTPRGLRDTPRNEGEQAAL